MLRAIIVDDEVWVVESIRSYIDWKTIGYEIVDHAYNGEDAFEKIRSLRPDVVLTDIRMPKMDGIELIKKVKQEFPDIIFIIISGHADFSYAQQAINEGAAGYCLKPVSSNDLIKMMEKAKGMLKTTKLNEQMQLFDMILSYCSSYQDRIKGILNNNGMMIGGRESLIPVVSIGDKEIEIPGGNVSLCYKLGVSKYAYIVQTEDAYKLETELSKLLTEEIKSIGIGDGIKEIHLLKQSLELANERAYQFFIYGPGQIFIKDTVQGREHILNTMLKDFENNDIKSIIKKLESGAEFVRQGNYSIRHVFYIYNTLLQRILRTPEEHIENYLLSYETLIEMYSSIDEMFKYLTGLVKESSERMYEVKSEDVRNKIMKEILNYINENFTENITIYSLAEKYYVNTSYISLLFKKEVGENFTDYLMKLRIKYACSLIENTKFTLQEIAEKSGYNDYFYFSKVFKKCIGKTPTEYKMSNN